MAPLCFTDKNILPPVRVVNSLGHIFITAPASLAGYWYFEYPHADRITIGYEGGESIVLTPGSEGYPEVRGEILNIAESINGRIKGVEEDWNMPERKKHADYVELEFSRPTDITTKIVH